MSAAGFTRGAFDAAALAEWRASGNTFAHRGHEIFVREQAGAGAEPLLCLHGFPSASFDWAPIWPGLLPRFSAVIAPDMIGFGWSAKPRGYDYSMFDQADLHEQLLRARGIRRVHLLAHDIGDTVAQELLARAAERRARGDDSLQLLSLVLLNGGLFPETHRPVRIQKLLLSPLGPLLSRITGERSFMPKFAAVFGPDTQPSEAELQLFWQLMAHNGGQRNLHRLIRYMLERRANRERWVGALQKTAVPLRLVDGAADPISGEHMTLRYRALIPNPDVVLLPRIGHYPQVEAPEAVLAALLAFHERLRAAE
ncbi:MAG: alpha/beta hydrolase [Nevskia sp.]